MNHSLVVRSTRVCVVVWSGSRQCLHRRDRALLRNNGSSAERAAWPSSGLRARVQLATYGRSSFRPSNGVDAPHPRRSDIPCPPSPPSRQRSRSRGSVAASKPHRSCRLRGVVHSDLPKKCAPSSEALYSSQPNRSPASCSHSAAKSLSCWARVLGGFRAGSIDRFMIVRP